MLHITVIANEKKGEKIQGGVKDCGEKGRCWGLEDGGKTRKGNEGGVRGWIGERETDQGKE